MCGSGESMSEHAPILEPPGNRPSIAEPTSIGPMTAVATNFGWAVDVLARQAAANAVDQVSSRHHRRALPPVVNTAVHARLAELVETMQPSHDEFESAFDIAVHGMGEPV